MTWNPHDDFITLLVACFAAPGFWKLLQNFFNRIRGKKSVEFNVEAIVGKQKDLEKNMADIKDKMQIEHDARIEADRRQREMSLSIRQISNSLRDEHDEREENDIKNARVRIIRFNDELLKGDKHSKTMFDNILIDCSDYEKYCLDHPHFKNNVATEAIEHIKRVYRKREENNDFL